MSVCICCGSCHKFREVHASAVEKDPTFFGVGKGGGGDDSGTNYGAMEDGKAGPTPLSDTAKEEVMSDVVHAAYKLLGSFVSQIFVLRHVGHGGVTPPTYCASRIARCGTKRLAVSSACAVMLSTWIRTAA